MKTGLQQTIDQIGLGAVLKSIPSGYKLSNCEMHGRYMAAPNTQASCPICPPTPPANGTDASTIEHYIDIKDAISPTSGDNPGQVANPTGISYQDIVNAKDDLDNNH